jgi:hypothetical protein
LGVTFGIIHFLEVQGLELLTYLAQRVGVLHYVVIEDEDLLRCRNVFLISTFNMDEEQS